MNNCNRAQLLMGCLKGVVELRDDAGQLDADQRSALLSNILHALRTELADLGADYTARMLRMTRQPEWPYLGENCSVAEHLVAAAQAVLAAYEGEDPSDIKPLQIASAALAGALRSLCSSQGEVMVEGMECWRAVLRPAWLVPGGSL